MYGRLILAGSITAAALYHNELDSSLESLKRNTRAIYTVCSISLDYSQTNRLIANENYQSYKSECHKRSAEKLLDLCRKNGGIYIKLGQHISSLVYLVPKEYCNTLKTLQDECPASSIDDMEEMLKQDTGNGINEFFSSFDAEPIGVASLAQVHKAVLRSTGQQVAVKLQHPTLKEHAPRDLETVKWLVKNVKQTFPDFEFDWLADEMERNLPNELDFSFESRNAEKCASLFKNQADLVYIPKVYSSSKRLLIMEFIPGSRVDDLEFLNQNRISPVKVSKNIAAIFNQMIFENGFLHADPHPGNIFIVPKPVSWISRLFRPSVQNFQLVLLDHGLYRQLETQFQVDYSKLWIAVINADEKNIEKCSKKLFSYDHRISNTKRQGIEYHRLFASMLSGRSWNAISAGEIQKERTEDEMNLIQMKASGSDFLLGVNDILSAVPRELLLVLKTNDLLRSIDHSLKVDTGRHMMYQMMSLSEFSVKCVTENGDFWERLRLIPTRLKLKVFKMFLMLATLNYC